jgi:hypothetical protein
MVVHSHNVQAKQVMLNAYSDIVSGQNACADVDDDDHVAVMTFVAVEKGKEGHIQEQV